MLRLDSGARYCDERVCVCVSVYLCVFLSVNCTADLHHIFMHVTYGRSSVLLWWRSNALGTSGFMDYVVFGQTKVARRRSPAEAQCTRSLGLGCKLCAVIPVADQPTHGTTFRALEATLQVAAPAAATLTVLISVQPIKSRR